MAFYSIEKRKTSEGETRYRCTVGVKKDGKYLFRERQTFSKQALAKTWGVTRVADLETNGIPEENKITTMTFGELMDLYMNHPHIKYGKTKSETLNLVRKCEIANTPLSEMNQKTYIEHCEYRASTGAGPSTIRNDIVFIGSVLFAAKPMFNVDVRLDDFGYAKYQMNKLRMITSSQKRSRRPTQQETDRLIDALKVRELTSYQKIPFSDIFMFSILTCMRIGEVTRIRWEDIDHAQKAVLVRDRKDPRKKIGNHMKVALLGEAWDIMKRQPEKDECIFPFKPKNISLVFAQERNKLGIKDLRYHDLRREGVSRLFEAGFTIEEVAQVSGHRSLSTLWQVYTELFPKSLHDRFDELQKLKIKSIQEENKNEA
ncbi:site-specific integrase [Pantoea sp. LMR881]|uniref:site-specific integrase n=1 Tax=Pantoea sp. LMR881 TaxID=3014336 RepID=UPI0022B01E11|nr:site-specific integrase [Pantoea sp. LMR881]MCZ4058236.1 site-specific integrase [Pantoea sp. LMR881]